MNATTSAHRVAPLLQRLTITVGGLLLAVICLAATFASTLTAIADSPFVWIDVSVVSLICAAPLAVVLAERLRTSLPRVAVLAVSLVLLFGVPWFTQSPFGTAFLTWGKGSVWNLAAVRLLLSLAATLGGTLTVASLLPAARSVTSTTQAIVSCLLLLAIAAAVPEAYLDSRCERERERMLDFAGNARYMDALQIARALSVLRPESVVELGSRELTIADYTSLLSDATQELESQLAELVDRDDDASRLVRARLLGQLSRRDEAIEVLLPVTESNSHEEQLEACLLLGTICEHQERWQVGLDWYERALQLITTSRRKGDPRKQVAALKGIAYTSRKLGRYPDAEAAYEKLIVVAPSAAHHFLLAQFYEDAQQGEKAQFHARKAMKLAPPRYRESGKKLIDRVVTSHFGCFGAYSREAKARSDE